jgi:hypothetical protein
MAEDWDGEEKPQVRTLGSRYHLLEPKHKFLG